MQVRGLFVLALAGCGAALPAGCACPEAPPAPVPAPVVEAPAAPVKAPPPSVPPAVSRALVRDTAAVQANARRFVARPSTGADKLTALDPLTFAVNRSLAVMELHHRREGAYRRADVLAARAAADAVARFLDQQPPPREDAPP